MKAEFEVVLAAAATLGEGPHWDHRRQLLLWVDIEGKKINEFDPVTRRNRAITLQTLPGAVVATTRGDLLVSVREGFARLDRDSGCLSAPITPAGHDPAAVRFNDGKCDPTGRFWAGTMSLSGETGAGALYCFEIDGRIRRVLTGVSISNGLAWSLDGSRLYFIDSATQAVAVFDYDAGTGTLHNRRIAIEIPPAMGCPDGMAIDAQGMLWIALWDGSAISHWDPNTGRLLGRYALPVSRVTSCAFGGPGLATLFVTSARTGLPAAELDRQPLAGAIFAFEPDVPGSPLSDFAG